MFIIVSTLLQHDSNSKYNHHTNGVYAFKGLQQRVQTFPSWCSTWKLQVKRCKQLQKLKLWKSSSSIWASWFLQPNNSSTNLSKQALHTGWGFIFFLLGLSWANLFGCHTVISPRNPVEDLRFPVLKNLRNKRKVGEFNLSMLPQQKRQLSHFCQSKTLEFLLIIFSEKQL